MKQSTCSAVICQPGGREQKHDTNFNFSGCGTEYGCLKEESLQH